MEYTEIHHLQVKEKVVTKTINAFILAQFLARTSLFFFVFGSFYSDLAFFVGLIGFSISLNGNARKSLPASTSAARPVPKKMRYPARLAPGH